MTAGIAAQHKALIADTKAALIAVAEKHGVSVVTTAEVGYVVENLTGGLTTITVRLDADHDAVEIKERASWL